MQSIPKIQDADLRGKIVLVRVDHNVVKKGQIKDPYRIDASLPTIRFILEKGGKPILMTHVGRPRDKKTGKITVSENTSVEPVVDYLNKKLNIKFKTAFDNKPDMKNKECVTELQSSKIDGIYLPNTRWFPGEEAGGEESRKFAKQLAQLADIFVNDAFGSWQPHASTVYIAEFLPSCAGLLMQKEIENLDKVLNPARPFVAVVAGSKFDTKIGPLTALLETADFLVIGGVLYNAYLCAKYGIKIKSITDEDISAANEFVELTKKYPQKIIELPAVVESDLLNEKIEGKFRIHNINEFTSGTELNYVLDVAEKSFRTEKIKEIFASAKTIFVNAVMGLTPNFAEGTISLDLIIDENKQAQKLFGGGDTLQEFKTLLPDVYSKALEDDKYYFFTGGGTILKAIKEGSVTGLGPIRALM